MQKIIFKSSKNIYLYFILFLFKKLPGKYLLGNNFVFINE